VTYRQVACVETITARPEHPHVSVIGTTDGARWTIAEVRLLIEHGDMVFTLANTKTAPVRHKICNTCGVATLTTAPDAPPANALDQLPRCSP
jgi:hypothetical protein